MSHLVEGRLRNAMAQLKREAAANKTDIPDCTYVVQWVDGAPQIKAATAPSKKRKATDTDTDGNESA